MAAETVKILIWPFLKECKWHDDFTKTRHPQDIRPRGYKSWVHAQIQNKAQLLAACGLMSASNQLLHFILSLKLYSSFITSRPGSLLFYYIWVSVWLKLQNGICVKQWFWYPLSVHQRYWFDLSNAQTGQRFPCVYMSFCWLWHTLAYLTLNLYKVRIALCILLIGEALWLFCNVQCIYPYYCFIYWYHHHRDHDDDDHHHHHHLFSQIMILVSLWLSLPCVNGS